MAKCIRNLKRLGRILNLKCEDKTAEEAKELTDQLIHHWKTNSDPLDPDILSTLDQLSWILGDPKHDLSAKYKTLVGVSGLDFNLLQDDFKDSAHLGPETLLAMIKIAIKAYSVAASKTATHAIADIAASAADIGTIAKVAMDQFSDYQESLKHLTLSWNSMSTSITKYMGQVDSKILEMSSPERSINASRPSPSLDSRSSRDQISGLALKLIPGHIYRSAHGVLTYISQDTISFVSDTAEGVMIGKLIDTLQKPKVLERVLNKDLNKMGNYLLARKEEVEKLKDLNKDDQVAFLAKMAKEVKDTGSQWSMTII